MSEQQDLPESRSLLKIAEVAAFLRCSPSNVYAAVASGELKAYRVGAGRGGLRISMAQVEDYLRHRQTVAITPERETPPAPAAVRPPFRHLKL